MIVDGESHRSDERSNCGRNVRDKLSDVTIPTHDVAPGDEQADC